MVNIVASALNDGSNSSLVTFVFSETVTGFAAEDLTAVGGTLSDFTVVDANIYSAIFTTDDGIETTGLVTVGTGYTDLAANAGSANGDTVAIDTLNPTVVVDIVASALTDGSNSSLVTLRVQRRCDGLQCWVSNGGRWYAL